MSLRAVPLASTFWATSRADLATGFYSPCLAEASAYDRAAGYFRSTFLVAATISFRDFALRGGRARVVCSPDLSAEDIQALERGYSMRSVVDEALLLELEQVLQRPQGETLTSILSTLVAVGALDLRVALRKDGRGIFHHKIGIFTDREGDKVSFLGSTNETWAGWNPEGNDESFEVFTSWESPERVARHEGFFREVWENREPGIETFSLPDAISQRLLTYSHPGGLSGIPRYFVGASIPSRPLYPHQEEALADWLRNGRRGLLEHSTGSGKTITALAAVRGWLKEGKPCLIVVPSELLLHQWRQESRRVLADIEPPTLLAGAGHGPDQWEPALAAFTAPNEGARLVIATLQTASTRRFLRRIPNPTELFVVVDEAHRAGSAQARNLFDLDAPARLGLSATPERAGDPDGTRAIRDYFVRTLKPVFTLRDAIEAGRLAPYRYHVKWLSLSSDEQEKWNALTQAIRREYAKLDDGEPPGDHVKFLLIKRAAIVKRADAKPELAASILRDEFEPGQSWLVYCDTQVQLDAIVRRLRRDGLPAFEYHSAMAGDRAATMKFFVANGGIVVSIRCLDEGVDIPRVSHALILASSRNRREFVQRRGRVLRRFPGKHHAEIFDALVRPHGDGDVEADRRLLGPEIARALVFARDAMNRAPEAELAAELARIGIDPEELLQEGIEPDE